MKLYELKMQAKNNLYNTYLYCECFKIITYWTQIQFTPPSFVCLSISKRKRKCRHISSIFVVDNNTEMLSVHLSTVPCIPQISAQNCLVRPWAWAWAFYDSSLELAVQLILLIGLKPCLNLIIYWTASPLKS